MNLTDANTPYGYEPDDFAIVTENMRQEFTCIVEAVRPAAEVAWYVGNEAPNGGIVNNSTRENAKDPLLTDTVSTLSFIPRRINHYDDLECVASVDVAGVEPYTFRVKLEVQGM